LAAAGGHLTDCVEIETMASNGDASDLDSQDLSAAASIAVADPLADLADDGWYDHLGSGRFFVPSTPLKSTDEEEVDLSNVLGRVLVFVFPRIVVEDGDQLDADDIAIASRCSDTAFALSSAYTGLAEHNVSYVFGLSNQSAAVQAAVSQRLDLPFALLSDAAGKVTAKVWRQLV